MQHTPHRLPLIRISPSPPPHPLSPDLDDMSATPIPINTINTTLQYLVPPSQINDPLPPYLLSKSLLQRHHFMSISHYNPEEYLCWPSESSSKAIDLLERVPTPIEDHAPPTYPVHYTSDGEYIYAHVALPPNQSDEDAVRLVFQYDANDGWKFHDLKTMPFPPGSNPSLRDTLASVTDSESAATESHQSATAAPAWNPYGFDHDNEASGDVNDDDYWNAYGAADSGSPSPRQAWSAKESAADSEDAYWAQYSSVHGTADSTAPSPRDPRRRPHSYAEQQQHDSGSPQPFPVPIPPAELLTIPPSFARARPRPGLGMGMGLSMTNKWEPASPSALARLLADISPRRSPVSFSDELSINDHHAVDFDGGELGLGGGVGVGRYTGFEGEGPGLGLGMGLGLGLGLEEALSPPSLETSDDSDETPSPPPGEMDRDVLGLMRGFAEAPSARAASDLEADREREDDSVKPSQISSSLSKDEVQDKGEDEGGEALRQSAKGLYALWRAGRVRAGKGGSEAEDKAAFVRIVGDAIGI